MAQEGEDRARAQCAAKSETKSGALAGAKGRARLERAMMGYLLERLGDEARPAGQAVTAADIQLALALLSRQPNGGSKTDGVASATETDALIRRKLDALAARA